MKELTLSRAEARPTGCRLLRLGVRRVADSLEQRGRQVALAGVRQHRQDHRALRAPSARPSAPRRTCRRRRCRRRCLPSPRARARPGSPRRRSRAGSRRATERSSTAGTKSGVQPWILCGLNSAPVEQRCAGRLGDDDARVRARLLDHLAGAGERAARAPAGDPEVEPLAGEVAAGSPGRSCCGDSRDSPGSRTGARGTSRACATAPRPCAPCREPRSAAGVRITFAPSMRMILRRSTEKRLGHHRDERIALGRAHHRERDAGVAGGRLDHGLAGLRACRAARRPR